MATVNFLVTWYDKNGEVCNLVGGSLLEKGVARIEGGKSGEVTICGP